MIRGLALSLILLAAGSSVFGQGRPAKMKRTPIPLQQDDRTINPDERPRPKYVRFEIEGNPEQMLGEFLKSKTGQGLLKQLEDEWQKLLREPPEGIEKLLKEKAGNSRFRKLVEEFLKENEGILDGKIGGDDLRDVVKKFGDKLKDDPDLVKKLTNLENIDVPKLPDQPPDNEPPGLPDVNKMIEPDKTLDERFGEWLKEYLTEDRQQEFLEWFKETPALQEAIGDLARSLRPGAEAGPDGKWLPSIPDAAKWKLDLKPPKLPWDLGQMPKLPTFKLPTPPRMNIPMPKIGPIHMPQLPNLGAAPEMPGTPRVGGSGDWLILVGAVFALGLTYFFLRRFRWDSAAEAPYRKLLASLPAEIQTRTELRRAFDLLALSRLGEKARPWNHRQIAGQLGDSDPSRRAAQAFAQLYEIARYTPGDERLSADERAAVHKSLAALTGAAA